MSNAGAISSRDDASATIDASAAEAGWNSRSSLLLLALLVGVALYVAWHLDRGWIPLDDGALAQGGERVLRGDLPHRDFDEVYSGALSFLNAAAFHVFGTNLRAIRIPLFAVFMAWVPAVYYLASRFVRPLMAIAATFLAVTWSLPNYTAAMPSWYNLFLATFGLAALFRHLEDGRRRWLVLAGVAGGLSFTVKVIGLYYVAGALLTLVAHARVVSRARLDANAPKGTGYAMLVTIGLGLFVAALIVLTRHQLTLRDLVQFVLPGTLMAALICRDEWTLGAGPSGPRFSTLMRLVVPFLVGAAVPVALMLLPYVRSGALSTFIYGVFILPTKRFGVASLSPGRLSGLLTALPPLVILLFAGTAVGGRVMRTWGAPALAIACALVLIAARLNAIAYLVVWHSALAALPLLIVVAVLVLRRSRAADARDPLLRERCIALLSVAGVCNLVQFPNAVRIYFFYVAPLVWLSALALSSYLPAIPRRVPLILSGFYLAFAMLLLNTASTSQIGNFFAPYEPTKRLEVDRGGIDVPVVYTQIYEPVVSLVRQHARGGYTWASPDVPEIYFLTGLRNPTRTMYDFFDEPINRSARILAALQRHDVTAVVLNRRPEFSHAIAADLVDSLAARYPNASEIGDLQVRWR